MKLQKYHCPYCETDHKESKKPNQEPILEGKCSANHKTPPNVGNWRVCHAPFKLFGGPNVIGSAHLCDPCWKKLFAPAYAIQKELLSRLQEDLK